MQKPETTRIEKPGEQKSDGKLPKPIVDRRPQTGQTNTSNASQTPKVEEK